MQRMTTSGPSSNYDLIVKAMLQLRPMICVYKGHPRMFCPIILGHSKGQEKTLVFQFGGSTTNGPLRRPDWKCFFVAELRELALHEGTWQSGGSHREGQTCVEIVDLDVNPHSPYSPRRRLEKLRRPSPGRRSKTKR